MHQPSKFMAEWASGVANEPVGLQGTSTKKRPPESAKKEKGRPTGRPCSAKLLEYYNYSFVS
jgi:hypothetical protein